MKTKCPHLEEGKKMHMCNAFDSLMVPSVYETTQYCTTDMHGMCEMFQMRKDMMRKTEMQQEIMM